MVRIRVPKHMSGPVFRRTKERSDICLEGRGSRNENRRGDPLIGANGRGCLSHFQGQATIIRLRDQEYSPSLVYDPPARADNTLAGRVDLVPSAA
jgi:hypothetical protein